MYEIKFWAGFFRVFGVNALFIYILAGLWTKIMLMVKLVLKAMPYRYIRGFIKIFVFLFLVT
ncbi:MAG: hypothetical protein R2744_03730 [Bacteroidales bacterium]